jgi:polysaccharide pyruvyl transferase WcaK-like protein
MWTLNRAHVAKINVKAKTSSVECVTTITDYKADPARDIKMLNSLLNHYESVYIWIQGAGDLSYIKSLERDLVKQLQYISPTLPAYDRFLQQQKRIDFIGTRLHAGIRALQWGHPATIVEVDNRAKEISKDTGLATWPRTADFDELVKHHSHSYSLTIALPESDINAWIDAIKEISIS